MSEDKPKDKVIRMNDMFEIPVLEDQVQSPIIKFTRGVAMFVDGPVQWFRDNVVERFRGPKYYYYHQKFRRVPTIDQCYTDDQACIWEASEQYKRDKKVDEQILAILRNRYFNCCFYERNVNEYYNQEFLCPKQKKEMQDSEINFFIKYGDLGPFATVVDAFYKQKHRLIFERRRAEKADQQSAN